MRLPRSWVHKLSLLFVFFALFLGAACGGELLPPQIPATSPVRQIAVRMVGSPEAAQLHAHDSILDECCPLRPTTSCASRCCFSRTRSPVDL